MAYITIAQFQERLGAALYARLTDRLNGTAGDDAVAQQIVDEAEAAAHAYLAQRFRTPLDATGQPELAAVLAARVLDLAEYGAWKSSPFISDPPGRVKALYADALRWLEDVARGVLALPAGDAQLEGVLNPRCTGAARIFTAEQLDGL